MRHLPLQDNDEATPPSRPVRALNWFFKYEMATSNESDTTTNHFPAASLQMTTAGYRTTTLAWSKQHQGKATTEVRHKEYPN
jgi:hypothetical protein